MSLGLLVTRQGYAIADGQVNPFYGSYQEDIPIQAPPFHGIEPKLSLHYDSSAGNGFVGVGWSLQGFSTIERASPGKGAPRYDASDIFLLDGQEMVPCQAGSVSPSCTTGGTHATKIESYARVAFDAAANMWTVTQKDGTRSTYATRATVGAGTYRWLLSSVTDTTGNAVYHHWRCSYDSGSGAYIDCRPDYISYATDRPRHEMIYSARPSAVRHIA